jgi:hypothetical protein
LFGRKIGIGKIDNERNEVLKWSLSCHINIIPYNIFTQITIFLFYISLTDRRRRGNYDAGHACYVK